MGPWVFSQVFSRPRSLRALEWLYAQPLVPAVVVARSVEDFDGPAGGARGPPRRHSHRSGRG